MQMSLTTSMAVGVSLGFGIGLIIDNLPSGVAVVFAIGAAMGMASDHEE